MLTCARPPGTGSSPRALMPRKPPEEARTTLAISLATSTLSVSRFTLKATRGFLAPTATTPAVGWISRPPKSGAHSASFSLAGMPSNWPLRTSARLTRWAAAADSSYRKTGICASSHTRRAARRDSSTQSSIVTSMTGTKGITSTAPMRGCSPLWRRRSIIPAAALAKATAASSIPSGLPTRVSTLRLCPSSACTSSKVTPGTFCAASESASITALSRPSLKLGMHSTSLGISFPPRSIPSARFIDEIP